MPTVLVTGGAGFIGSAVCRHLVGSGRYRVVNLDKLTYAGNLTSLRDVEGHPNYQFYQDDICDVNRVRHILAHERVDRIMHLAAESHVDRSIAAPMTFVTTNVIGTVSLLTAALSHWKEMDRTRQEAFRFHHVSTDEVYGDLPFDSGIFTEETSYKPSSPYSASKASSDHFVRAWHETYGLPVVISNCSNNYGSFHFPEKLIPLVIVNALSERPIPVYGSGANVRDWLFVDDHAHALELVMSRGRVGDSYNIGGRSERTNLQVVQSICDLMDLRRPRSVERSYRDLITFVGDRPGHDRRYAIDASKIEQELGWSPSESFESGLSRTVDWYLANQWWWRPLHQVNIETDRPSLAGVV